MVKHRDTREVIAGLYDERAIVGRTVPLKPDQSAQLAAVLAPARVGHPRPDEISSQGWGGRGAEATHQGRTNRGGRGER